KPIRSRPLNGKAPANRQECIANHVPSPKPGLFQGFSSAPERQHRLYSVRAKVILINFPDQREVGLIVGMAQPIADASDVPPWHAWTQPLRLRPYTLCR